MSLQALLEFTRVALVALRLNKLRSALTALGIIIGVASVIVMAAIGNGATIALQRQISALGTSVLNVMPTSMLVGGRRIDSLRALEAMVDAGMLGHNDMVEADRRADCNRSFKKRLHFQKIPLSGNKAKSKNRLYDTSKSTQF